MLLVCFAGICCCDTLQQQMVRETTWDTEVIHWRARSSSEHCGACPRQRREVNMPPLWKADGEGERRGMRGVGGRGEMGKGEKVSSPRSLALSLDLSLPRPLDLSHQENPGSTGGCD